MQRQQTVEVQANSWKRPVCNQVSNYPFDICKFGALFLTEPQKGLKGLNLLQTTKGLQKGYKLKRAKFVFCYIPFLFNFEYYIKFHSRFILTIGKHEVQKEFYT